MGSRLLSFAVLFLIGSRAAFGAQTIVVDPDGGDFPTLKEASAQARPGDTVLIRAHAETLESGAFKSGIVYIGMEHESEALELKSVSGVTLQGFWLSRLEIEGCKAITVKGGRLANGYLHILDSEDVRILNNAFAPAGTVMIEKSQGILLSGNLIQGSYAGVTIEDSGAVLEKNTIVNARRLGRPLNPDDLADAHDANTQGAAILVKCGYEKKAQLDARENIIAFNQKGLVVDQCPKSSHVELHNNIWFENGNEDRVTVNKEYSGSSFKYVVKDILSPREAVKTGNNAVDPLFNDRQDDDFSLKTESPALWMGEKKGTVGANPEAVKVSPIYMASIGDVKKVAKLLDRGADVNAGDSHGFTALMAAAVEGHAEVVALLLDRGAAVDAKDNDGKNAMIGAALAGHAAVIEILVARGADVNIKDNNGWTPLITAASSGDPAGIKILLAHGADVDAKDSNGWSALANAAITGHADAIKLLLAGKAKVNVKDKDGRVGMTDPLIAAIFSGHSDTAAVLLDHGADIHAKVDRNGMTALIAAAFRGDVAAVKLLLARGARVDEKDDHGRTVLMAAVDSGHAEAAKLLIEHGADVNAKDEKWGIPALMKAAQYGDIDIAKLLLEHGADIKARENTGKTALTAAALGGHTDMAKLLIDRGIDRNVRDKDGKTALDFACSGGKQELVQVLGGTKGCQ